MKLSNRTAFAFLLAAGAVCAGGVFVACSSSGSGGNGNGNGNGNDASTQGGDSGGSVSTSPGSCANPTISLVFAPMYSAFIPGSTAQQFQIPVITADGNTATWSASDPTQVNMQTSDFGSGGVSQPGVLVTMNGIGNGQGQVTIYATESGGACGASILTITQNTEDDWTTGNARYNDGVSLSLGPPKGFEGGIPDGGFHRPDGGFGEGGGGGGGGGGFHTSDGGSFFEVDGGTACTNCHGVNATNFIFKDVQHTPEQTGGFSDEDLANIIHSGQLPDGGYFDPSVFDGLLHQTCDDAGTNVSPDWPQCAQRAYTTWSGIHQWTDIDLQTQMPGVICYLRSLEPQAQTGTSNFGGGGHHHDGGPGGGKGGGGTPDGGDGG